MLVSKHGVLVQLLLVSMTTTVKQWDAFKIQLGFCWQQIYDPLFWIVSALYSMLESTSADGGRRTSKARSIVGRNDDDEDVERVYCNVNFYVNQKPAASSSSSTLHGRQHQEVRQQDDLMDAIEQEPERLNTRRKSLKLIVGDHMQQLGTKFTKRRRSLFSSKKSNNHQRIFFRRSSVPAESTNMQSNDEIPVVHPLDDSLLKRKHKKIFTFFAKRRVQPLQ